MELRCTSWFVVDVISPSCHYSFSLYRWNSNGTVRDRRTSRMGISAYDHRQRAIGPLPSPVYLDTKAPLLTFMSRSKILASNGLKPQVEPLYSDPLPGTLEAVPVCSASPISSKFRRPEPIYATLSETMSSSNTLESLSRSRRNASRHRAMDSEDEGSATESAGDDFEFHNTRSSRQTLVIHDAVMEHSRKSPDFISHQPTVKQDDVQLKPRAKVTRSATYRILCNGLDVKCAKRQDPQSTLTTSSESQHGIVTCITFQVKIPLLYPPSPRLLHMIMLDDETAIWAAVGQILRIAMPDRPMRSIQNISLLMGISQWMRSH
jgi:hypothetical protein